METDPKWKKYQKTHRESYNAYHREYNRKHKRSRQRKIDGVAINPKKVKNSITLAAKKEAMKKTILSVQNQQIEARKKAGMEPARGKSYAEYIREAMKRKGADRVYKKFATDRRSYHPIVDDDQSVEVMQDQE